MKSTTNICFESTPPPLSNQMWRYASLSESVSMHQANRRSITPASCTIHKKFCMLSEQQCLILRGDTYRVRHWPVSQSQAGGLMHQTFSFPALLLNSSWEAAPHFSAESGLHSRHKAQISSSVGNSNHGSGKPAWAALTVLGAVLEWEMDKALGLKGGDLMEWLLVFEGCHDRILEESTGSYEQSRGQGGWLLG